MARYGQAFKDKAVARMLPPASAPAEEVAREVGISVSTLQRWHSEALAQSLGKKVWTAAARFDAVLVTAAMDESAKAAWCRANGVFLKDLQSDESLTGSPQTLVMAPLLAAS